MSTAARTSTDTAPLVDIRQHPDNGRPLKLGEYSVPVIFCAAVQPQGWQHLNLSQV
jgi:hypothetical protein